MTYALTFLAGFLAFPVLAWCVWYALAWYSLKGAGGLSALRRATDDLRNN